MATTALATVYNRCLRRLNVLGRLQTANSEDTADMVKAYLEVYDFLDRKNLVSWDVDDEVPNEFVNQIIALMAKNRLDDYSVGEPRRSQIRADAASGLLDVSGIQAPPKLGATEIENY